MTPAESFLQAIFSDKPANHNVLVWTLNRIQNTKTNNFFTDITKAAEFATSDKPEGTDVYFCVGTLPKLKKGRGKLSDVLGIASVHLDVDIQNSQAHKKQNLPATIDEAIAFVNQFKIKPSAIISSGYGIHAYWFLQQFIAFVDEQTRVDAAQLIESWQKMYKWAANKQGYEVDATQDITRVLRVPDTLNWKIPAHPVQAKILHLDTTLRYTPAELHEYLDEVRQANKVEKPVQPALNGHAASTVSLTPYNDIAITLDPNATIPADAFEALQDNIPKFKATWNRTRKDLPDQTGSSYDMALANMAIGAGIDDQTTANLLIWHRRKHDDEKLRLDYLQRTIAEAKAGMQKEREIVQAAQRKSDPTDPNDKETLKADLYKMLGIQIVKIDVIMSDPPSFIIHFAGGKSKNFGDGAGLLDQNLFRKHVFNATRKVVKKLKEPLYETAVQKMGDLADEIELPDEATEMGDIRDMLATYISKHLVIGATEKEHRANAARHAPAVINGKVCIHALEFWQFTKRQYGYRKEKKDLVSGLKRLDAAREVFNVRDDHDKQHSVSVYCLPAEWLPPGAVKAGSDTSEDVDYAGKL